MMRDSSMTVNINRNTLKLTVTTYDYKLGDKVSIYNFKIKNYLYISYLFHITSNSKEELYNMSKN